MSEIRATGAGAPTDLLWRGRKLRLKWHKLRRQAADPPFARGNLRAGLAAGASLEVDIRRLACGRFVCLHDDRLESETSGHGPVAEIEAEAVCRLEMRGGTGEPPLLLDELAATLRAAPAASTARVQLDLRASADDIDTAARGAFARAIEGLAAGFILSGYDWDVVRRLGEGVAGLALGYDPSQEVDAADLADLVRARAPEADTVYLHRGLVRASQARGDGLVARLRARGHRVDCWTLDQGTAGAEADLDAAADAGCDQITTNTALAWATHGNAPPG